VPQRGVALADCHLPKLAQTLSCGTLDVPEHRGDPASRRLSIAVAILPANTLSPKPDPLFVLAGGPGQAASSIADFAARLSDVRTTRDIVLVDQRGTGRSSPLDCKAFARSNDLADALDIDPLPKARACAAEIAARGVDLARYTTDDYIADLEDVRRALGYPKVNLWGGSYGTRVAQEYLRRHPGVIRSVVLDGVAPPSMIVSLDVWTTRERAIDAVVAACGGSTACRAAHPDIAATLDAIHTRLGDAVRDVALTMPRTGETRTIRIGFDAFLAALQPIVYQPESAALLPEILARARDGDFAPLVATLSAFDDAMEGELNAALHYAVTCAEDVPRVTPARERAALVLDLRDFGARNLVMVDHVHPTAFGQVWIAERALDVLGMEVRARPSTLIRPGSRTRWRALQGDWTYVYRRLKVLRAQASAAARQGARAARGRSGSSPTRAR